VSEREYLYVDERFFWGACPVEDLVGLMKQVDGAKKAWADVWIIADFAQNEVKSAVRAAEVLYAFHDARV